VQRYPLILFNNKKAPQNVRLLKIFILEKNYPKTSFTFLPISAGESTT
jgi:hypothetical protein